MCYSPCRGGVRCKIVSVYTYSVPSLQTNSDKKNWKVSGYRKLMLKTKGIGVRPLYCHWHLHGWEQLANNTKAQRNATWKISWPHSNRKNIHTSKDGVEVGTSDSQILPKLMMRKVNKSARVLDRVGQEDDWRKWTVRHCYFHRQVYFPSRISCKKRLIGEPRILWQSAKHPAKVHVWAGISKRSHLHCTVPGKHDSHPLYTDFRCRIGTVCEVSISGKPPSLSG